MLYFNLLKVRKISLFNCEDLNQFISTTPRESINGSYSRPNCMLLIHEVDLQESVTINFFIIGNSN